MKFKISEYAEITTIIATAIALYVAITINTSTHVTMMSNSVNSILSNMSAMNAQSDERMKHMDEKWLELFKIYLDKKK